MEKTKVNYTIGNIDEVYTKVYDGAALQANAVSHDDLQGNDTFEWKITNDKVTHVADGQLELKLDDGYPHAYRDGVDMTNEYIFTQVQPAGCETFTITERPITLQSATLTKEYDGKALTAYSLPGGTDVTDLTEGVTDKGYVTDEKLNYSFAGSQFFVGESDNVFDFSDSETAFASDYDVTEVYGKLIVTGRTVPVTITVENQERLYDGTANIDAFAYTLTGELALGDEIWVTLANSNVDAGTYTDGITATYKIMHGDVDVTDMYLNVTVDNGDLVIKKRNVEITSGSAQKTYDGTPLTKNSIQITAGDGFVGGEAYTANVTGSRTEVGSSKNTFEVLAGLGTNLDNYSITKVEGDLEVTPKEVTITIGIDLQTGLEFLYDNTSEKTLTDAQYQYSGLAAGDSLVNVTVTTSSSNAGVYEDYQLTYDIVNAAGESVKNQYVITEVLNDIEITKRTITIDAGSASKMYDGTALTCGDYKVVGGSTAETLLDGENVSGVKMTENSTITHASSTANQIDSTSVVITKADGSDSSMNYNVICEDGTLTVTQRPVLLISTSADKFYDGTALQNRQVIVTGLDYLEGKPVISDGFLKGDGCTYEFVGDDKVIDKDGNIISWIVSEQSNTAYGQTEVGSSMNEFNYHNFTSVYYGSYETDYQIIYGNSVPQWFVDKYGQKTADSLFGELTVWGGPVEIKMTDYSWTYDFQSKTNGYFDDGYTVKFTTKEDGSESDTTTIDHNSEGYEIALFGDDVIVVNVTGQGGSFESGKVQHVSDGTKQNTATYTIYRNGMDVTAEVKDYYQIDITGGTLCITPRMVDLVSGTATKLYDGTPLTNNTVTEGSEGSNKGFIFGEGAVYNVTGSQTEVGVSENTFEISKLLADTQETDYEFNMVNGKLVVNAAGKAYVIADTTISESADYEEISVDNCMLTIDNAAAVKVDALSLNSAAVANNGALAVINLAVSGSNNAISGYVSKISRVEMEDGADLTVNLAQYKRFIAESTFAESDGAVLKVDDSLALELTTGDVEAAAQKANLDNVVFAQALTNFQKLTIKTSGEAKSIEFNGAAGTKKSDSIRVMKDADIMLGTADTVIDLAEGNNSVQVDKNANAAFLANFANVSSFSTAAGSVVSTADIAFQQGRNASLKAAGNFTAGNVTGSDKANTIAANGTEFTAGSIVLGDKNDSIAIGKDGQFNSADIDFGAGSNSFNVGARAEAVVAGSVTGVSKLTLANGTYIGKTDTTLWTKFEAAAVIGTEKNDTFNFGNDSDAKIAGSIVFGEGNDTLKVGNCAKFTAGDIFSAETVRFGAYSEVQVGEITGVKKLTVSNGTSKDGGTGAAVSATAVTGTDKSDSVNFGWYNNVTLESLELGEGNDALTIGKGTTLNINGVLDFGAGSDKMTIGQEARLNVDYLEVDSLKSLSMDKNSWIVFADAENCAAAQKKWAKYSDQMITLA